MIGNNGIGGNCSTVSRESLTKKRSIIPKDEDPLIKVPPSNSNSTNYEQRITELENNQRLAESKIKIQNQVLKENHNLIHDWIIPTLGLIFTQTDSLEDQEHCIQQNQKLMQHAEKLLEAYKKLD